MIENLPVKCSKCQVKFPLRQANVNFDGDIFCPSCAENYINAIESKEVLMRMPALGVF